MFFGSMTENQKDSLTNLVLEASELGNDFNHNESILNDITLSWFQCFCVQHAFHSKGTMISLGTGLGKTIVGIALIQKVLNYVPKSKSLFFCLPESVDQIDEDFKKYSDLITLQVTGEAYSIENLRRVPLDNYDTLVISYQALYSRSFCNWFVEYKNLFTTAVFDEAHMLSQDSSIHYSTSALCDLIEYRVMLTATPITVSPLQPITLINMLDRHTIPEGSDILKPYEVRDQVTFEVIDYTNLKDFTTLLYPRYVSWTREELGLKGEYKPKLYLVNPTEDQITATANEAYRKIKGIRNSNQVITLREILKDKQRRYLKGLVYVYNLELADMLYEELTKSGLRVAIANGDPIYKDVRNEVFKEFANGEFDCILTNLTMSLNLSCDYVVFYQNTNRAIQMIGRAERGFLPVDLEIDYILTEGTVEIEQFYNNVYKRCKWMGEMLQKDVDIFERFKKALKL